MLAVRKKGKFPEIFTETAGKMNVEGTWRVGLLWGKAKYKEEKPKQKRKHLRSLLENIFHTPNVSLEPNNALNSKRCLPGVKSG